MQIGMQYQPNQSVALPSTQRNPQISQSLSNFDLKKEDPRQGNNQQSVPQHDICRILWKCPFIQSKCTPNDWQSMLGLMQTDDSELALERIFRQYPKKALGLFRIYEWIQKDTPPINNK
jgi:hypothetical protein